MAAITTNSARAYHGLQATAEPTSEGTSGTLTIGQGQMATTLAYAGRAVVLGVEIDSTYTVSLDLTTLLPTVTGAGVAQVETATAAGTITAAGNATVIVTGDDITGSPLTVSVAVANTDTAATWAGKVRTALGLQSAITSLYTVGGSSSSITLSRIVPRYNDFTLNISLNNGTCTGITPALTSANTTAEINPAKCWRISGTTYAGDDFQGIDFEDVNDYQGIHIRQIAGPGEIIAEVDSLAWKDLIGPNEQSLKFTASNAMAGIGSGSNMEFSTSTSYCKAIVTLLFS